MSGELVHLSGRRHGRPEAAPASSAGRIVVIAVGNAMRRDDGAGPAVLRRARPALPASVEAVECGGDLTCLLDLWDGARVAVVVDATRRPGAGPGQVTWISGAGPDTGSLAGWRGGLDTHGLGVGEMVSLGRVLGRLPRRLDLLGVEAEDGGQGEGLSLRVAVGVEKATMLLISRVREMVES